MAEKFKSCSVEGCNGNAHKRARGCKGYCSAHYQRLKRHGDPLGGSTPTGEPMRFILEVAVPFKGGDCLFWPFGRHDYGYGQVWFGGNQTKAHRYICELVHGEPPTEAHQAAHNCGKGHLGCVNPNHIEWKTRPENEADKLIHGTHNRGARHGMAKLNEQQVLAILRLKGAKTQQAIADEYGVSIQAISRIHLRRAWAHINP